MENSKSNYNKDLKPLAKNLRNNSTLGEIILWKNVLRAGKMHGFQFNRQFPMQLSSSEFPPLEKGARGIQANSLDIIVDFICRKLKLIIEIDGNSHNHKYQQDIERDIKLKEARYKVIRFTENQVKHDLESVRRIIEQIVLEIYGDNPPNPLSQGGVVPTLKRGQGD